MQPAEAIPAADLLGSVQQTQADLAAVAKHLREDGHLPPSGATVLTRLARELSEAAQMVRAVPGQPPARAVPRLSSASVRGLLTSVAAALDIPAPAGPDDEVTFLRLRSGRAGEALRAVLNVLDVEDRTELDLAWTAASLDAAIRQHPADGYEHSPESS